MKEKKKLQAVRRVISLFLAAAMVFGSVPAEYLPAVAGAGKAEAAETVVLEDAGTVSGTDVGGGTGNTNTTDNTSTGDGTTTPTTGTETRKYDKMHNIFIEETGGIRKLLGYYHENPTISPEGVVDADLGTEQKDGYGVYYYNNNSNSSDTGTDRFNTKNKAYDLSEAEFTITKAGENVNKYYIQSVKTGQYYLNEGSAYFSDKKSETYIGTENRVENGANVTYFYFEKDYIGDLSKKRYLVFSNASNVLHFNRIHSDKGPYDSTGNNSWAAFLVLLKKKNNSDDGEEVISGYVRAKEVQSGENYLIAYKDSIGWMVFHPTAGSQTALVSDANSDIGSEVTLMARATGSAVVTVNNEIFNVRIGYWTNLTKLKEIVEKVEYVRQSQVVYNKETWDDFTTWLFKAKKLLGEEEKQYDTSANRKTKQDEIDIAESELKTAYKALVFLKNIPLNNDNNSIAIQGDSTKCTCESNTNINVDKQSYKDSVIFEAVTGVCTEMNCTIDEKQYLIKVTPPNLDTEKLEEFEKLLGKAAARNIVNYTEETWNTLKSVLEKAQTLYNKIERRQINNDGCYVKESGEYASARDLVAQDEKSIDKLTIDLKKALNGLKRKTGFEEDEYAFLGEKEGSQGDGKPIKQLILFEGASYKIKNKDGSPVTVKPSDIVAVKNGQISDEPSDIITIDNDGIITAAIFKDDTKKDDAIIKVGGQELKVTVLENEERTEADTRTIDMYVANTVETRVLFVYNLRYDNMMEIVEGCVIYGYVRKSHPTALSFFGDPTDGYALANMGASGSFDHYMLLHENGSDQVIPEDDPLYGLSYCGKEHAAGVYQKDAFRYYFEDTVNGSKNAVKSMVQAAIREGCDGGHGFTRVANPQTNNDIPSTLQFISEKLPTVDKQIYKIKKNETEGFKEYVPGETIIQSGNEILFRIQMTRYYSFYGINYQSGRITDTMKYFKGVDTDKPVENNYYFSDEMGRNLYSDQRNVKEMDVLNDLGRDNISNASLIEKGEVIEGDVYQYFVRYLVTDADVDRKLQNEINLNFQYHSHFSGGEYNSDATAIADASVIEKKPDDYVIDFGSPVEIEIDQTVSSYPIVETIADEAGNSIFCSASYGKIEVGEEVYQDNIKDKNHYLHTKIKYIPDKVMQDKDKVTIINNQGAVYHFTIYPATTVYYEEGFANYLKEDNTTDWKPMPEATPESESTKDVPAVAAAVFNKGRENQQASKAESKTVSSDYNYGYDSSYVNNTGYEGSSDGTSAFTDTPNSTAEITFTGTGIDVYTNNTTNTGVIMCLLQNSKNEIKGLYTVDTKMQNSQVTAGSNSWTTNQAVSAFNVPILSLSDLPHDAYTLKMAYVMVMKDVKNGDNVEKEVDPRGGIYIDGFRVYDTMNSKPSQPTNPASTDSTTTGSTSTEDKTIREIYGYDNENFLGFVELRDLVLGGVTGYTYPQKGFDGSWYLDASDSIIDQVLKKHPNLTGTGGALVFDNVSSSPNDGFENSNNTQATVITDLINSGPKNEFYLRPGQTVVFKINTANVGGAQIGLKALNAPVQYSMNTVATTENTEATENTDSAEKTEATANTDPTINTGTDMFYKVDLAHADAQGYVTVTIRNTSENTSESTSENPKPILSITKIKLLEKPATDDGSGSGSDSGSDSGSGSGSSGGTSGGEQSSVVAKCFAPLTADDIAKVLVSMGFPEDGKEPGTTEPETNAPETNAPAAKTDINKCSIALPKTPYYTYTGKAIKPTPQILSGKTILKQGTDYEVTYRNNVKAGKGSMTITGKGAYEGSCSRTFLILPGKTKLASVKPLGKGKVKVRWKKNSQADGYMVLYSTKANFKKAKKKIVKKKSSSLVLSLKKGKKYYIKVCAYKRIDGKKRINTRGYSARKTVKVK